MDADRWARIDELYHQAAALDGADRAAFLTRACGNDRALLAEVEALLAEEREEGAPFLEEPALAVAARLVTDDIPVLTGAQFGPYLINGLLGAGGMGDVYRARDTVLRRDVAIKILPEAFSDDPERLSRFKQEAQFLASLSHPNVAAIYGVHEADGIRGLVLELVDGETLAQRIQRGAVPLYEAVRIARQIGDGLDAAHQRGIVHRDLKPSNIKTGRDGTTKILDFGLAKSSGDGRGTADRETASGSDGLILGTASYMSPEQARGDPVDKRTDIWAFGCVLFEMLTGQPAFRRKTADGRSAARETQPDWDLLPATVPSGVRALLQRCLEEDPKRRRRDVGDVLVDLDGALSAQAGDMQRVSPLRKWGILIVTVGLVATGTAFWAGWAVRNRDTNQADSAQPTWRKLTFGDGYVHTARFAPDGQTVLYSASWGGQPFQIFSTTPQRPESRALDLPPAGLLAVSRSGQLALSLTCEYVPSLGGCNGTLARVPILGGAPRSLATNVRSADWGPNDTLAAVVSERLESPLGTPLSDRRAGHVRVSPDGQRLAFTERQDDSWLVVLRQGQTRRVLSEGWTFISGLAWAPDGEALFVSGVGPDNHDDGVSRIAMDATTRIVLRSRPRVRLLDVDSANRLLVDQSVSSSRAWIQDQSAGDRRDLTWLGSSVVDAISDDGRMALLTVRTGPTLASGRPVKPADLYPIYVRPVNGGPATFLGNGYGHALSEDGRWALTSTRENRDSKLVLYPLGPGTAPTLDRGGLDTRPRPSGAGATADETTNASFAGSNRIVFVARRGDGPLQTYVQSIHGGPPTRVEHEPGRLASPVAPDGERFISQRSDGSLWLASLAPGTAVQLPFRLQSNQFIRQWAEDGRHVFVLTVRDDRWVLTKVDLKTGRVQPHREIMRSPLDDRMFESSVRISRDGRVIAGTSNRTVSDLYLVEGVQ